MAVISMIVYINVTLLTLTSLFKIYKMYHAFRPTHSSIATPGRTQNSSTRKSYSVSTNGQKHLQLPAQRPHGSRQDDGLSVKSSMSKDAVAKTATRPIDA